ncbi:copper chaperone PCu(A)C [Streptomyces sp. NBC_01341]|uniref:copper chaperone PCu(A)C n=1 Tax=Streptomyces sp. NBC_01341 TaxID=2903831 RepID=UPI002E10E275|nr:copper chaperone PCu(A)C [Streptomyces sp. NBC_01341]
MRRRKTVAGTLTLATGLALAACSSDGPPRLEVTGAFMPQPVSDMAAGFLLVKNSGGATDRLTSVTSSLSDHVSIHETRNRTMRMVTSFEVPAKGELNLERGGSHIMFTDLKQRPKPGETVSVELNFEKADPIKVDIPVKETTYNPKKQ